MYPFIMNTKTPDKLASLFYLLKIDASALSEEVDLKKVCKNFTKLLYSDKDIGIGDLEKHVSSEKERELFISAKEWIEIAARPSQNFTDPALSASLSQAVLSIASLWECISKDKNKKEEYLLQARLELIRLLCAA